MKFKDFLDSLLPGDNVLPIDKLKTDLETFKAAFNYAEKTDEIYNNLIDNIVKLLRIKFGEYEIIYTSPNVMYNELLITLNPQLPQFLMIQKKQLIESLDTFGNLNNWGDVLKDNVKRALNLSDVSNNQTSYVPIDGADKDPYSVNDVDNRREQSETTDVSRLATDYLTFYKKIRWNIASIELNKIYADYIKLFKIYYQYDSYGLTVNGSVYDMVQQNTKNIEMLAEEMDKTNYQVGNNTSNIVLNSNNIQSNSNAINQNKSDLVALTTKVDNNTANISTNTQAIANINTNLADNYYQKSESDNRFGTLTQQQTNTQNIQTNQNNIQQITNSLQSSNFVLYKGVYSSNTTYNLADAVTFNNNWYVSNQANNLNHTPQNTSDAYWELLTTPPSVNLANYYTKPESDAKFATTNDLSGRINQINSNLQTQYLTKSEATSTYATISTTTNLNTRLITAEQTLNTNSTNIVNLENTKANKSDVYTKTESDNKYGLKSDTLKYKNIPYNGNYITTVRNQVYFGNRRVHLYRILNTGINLGLIENVVYRSNDNIFVLFSWYIDVYNNELKILLDRFDNTNDWHPNFSVDIYYRA